MEPMHAGGPSFAPPLCRGDRSTLPLPLGRASCGMLPPGCAAAFQLWVLPSPPVDLLSVAALRAGSEPCVLSAKDPADGDRWQGPDPGMGPNSCGRHCPPTKDSSTTLRAGAGGGRHECQGWEAELAGWW